MYYHPIGSSSLFLVKPFYTTNPTTLMVPISDMSELYYNTSNFLLDGLFNDLISILIPEDYQSRTVPLCHNTERISVLKYDSASREQECSLSFTARSLGTVFFDEGEEKRLNGQPCILMIFLKAM
jgi:hypothetical protein